jgi:hypothetical protein
MGGTCRQIGEITNAFKISVGKPEWKIPLGRPRRRWIGNIRMDLREIYESEEGRVAGSCEHGNEFSVSIKGGVFLDYLSDY